MEKWSLDSLISCTPVGSNPTLATIYLLEQKPKSRDTRLNERFKKEQFWEGKAGTTGSVKIPYQVGVYYIKF